MTYKIENIMETFECDREQAKEIEKLIKKIAVEGLEEKIEQEVPF